MLQHRAHRRSTIADLDLDDPKLILSAKFALKLGTLNRRHSVGWLPENNNNNKANGNNATNDKATSRASGDAKLANGGVVAMVNNGINVTSGVTLRTPAVGRGLTRGISMVEQTVLDMNTNLPFGILKKKPSVSGGSSVGGDQRTLHQFARDGDVSCMKVALEALGNAARHQVNFLNEDRLTPLHYAARYNHYPMVKLLVEYGAIVHIRGEDGLTPLHFAARYRSSKHHRSNSSERSSMVLREIHVHEEEEPSHNGTDDDEVFEKVEDKIGNANTRSNCSTWNVGTQFPKFRLLKGLRSISNDDLLEMSSSFELEENFKSDNVILYLVSQSAEVNVKDDYGLTPLHYSAMRGNAMAAKDLLSCPAINIEARDAEEMTPLHLTAIHNNPEIARILINAGANLRCRDEHMATPLHRAATEGNLEIAQMLLETAELKYGGLTARDMVHDRDHDQSMPLHLAVESGHFKVVSYLISKGADVNTPRDSFVYPLHLAAVAGDAEIVKILLQSNERIDCLNANGETPLHRAAEFNHAAVINILVQHGANIERKDKNDFTPLLTAASHGHVEAIERLLNQGADFYATDKDDKTAIYWAVQQNKPNAVMALIKDPRSQNLINKTDRYGNSLLHIATLKGYLFIMQLLLDMGAPTELKNEMEQTPLHLAAWHGRTKIVKDLIRHNKTIINSEDEEGNTPLHMAALAGHDNVIQALLEVGANIECRNSHLWTALDCSASRGFINSVRILLAAGCPIEPQEKTKTTPLHLAAGSGSVDVVLLLLENGADVSRRDDQGRNCLEIAIDHSNKEVAKAIIQSDHWIEALRSESYNDLGIKQTPLRLLIKKMPEVAEDVLNRCSQTNNLPPEHSLFSVSFNYELIDDIYVTFDKQESEVMNSSRGSIMEDSFDTKSTLKLTPDAVQNSYDGSSTKKNHPLMLMVGSGQQRLLAHPLCTTLLHLKWVNFGRYIYYTNLAFYLIYLTFLTSYILTIPTPGVVTDNDGDPVPTPMADPLTENETKSYGNCSYPIGINFSLEVLAFTHFSKYVISFLAVFHLLKEFIQLYMIRLNYLSLENLMEWSCYVTALLTVIDFDECSYLTGMRDTWQWQLGSIAIFLAWMNLVMFISKLPYLGLYVIMFYDVFTSFCRVFVVFFIFIVAFALGFHIAMYYEMPYDTAAKSIVRIIVMMLGEFQFDNLFMDNLLQYPAPAFFLFIGVMVLISLITMNTLVALAVDDIKLVQANAHIKRLAMQVELILNVESLLPKMFRERFVIHEHTFIPNQRNNTFFSKVFAKISATQTLNEILTSPEPARGVNTVMYRCKLSLIEKILEQQDKLLSRTLNTDSVVSNLQSENEKLQCMLSTLLQHQGLGFEDEDKQP